jgi:uncharacterized protein (TIGR03000 family)
MYGVVLLLAATAGGESTSWGRGCYGCYGGCYGGGYGGCYGGGCYGGGCYGGGCYGGCYGTVSYGCYGGGCYGGYGTVSYGCGGCYGGYGGAVYSSCCGGTPGIPQQMGKPDQNGKPDQDGKKKKKKGGKGGSVEDPDLVNAATIEVTLPASAELKIDGNATTSTSSVRRFRSPTLEPGKTYFYTFQATYQLEGKPVTVSKKVTIQAGKHATVDLNQTASAVVSK